MYNRKFHLGDVCIAKSDLSYHDDTQPYQEGNALKGDIFIVISDESDVNVTLLGANKILSWPTSWQNIWYYFDNFNLSA